MNSQLWVVNTLFVVAFGVMLVYMYFVTPHIPLKMHLAVVSEMSHEGSAEKVPPVNAIFERDLFNAMPAFIEEKAVPRYKPQTLVVIPQMPQPPQLVHPEDLVLPEPQFLPPLALALKGTVLSSNPAHNRVFVENTKTKEEKSLRLGDMIEDAQIVFIGKNKAIFIRSNGQEEILYINPLMAQDEMEPAKALSWQKIVQQNAVGEYVVDVYLLLKRIPTVGHFLEALDLITVFEGPVPIGCQVGDARSDSLIYALGLETHDVIMYVNETPTATPEERIAIYRKLVSDVVHDGLIKVRIKRKGHEKVMVYRINMPPLQVSSEKIPGILGLGKDNVYRGNSYKTHHMHEQVEQAAPYVQNVAQEAKRDTKKNTWRGGQKQALYRAVE